MSCTRDSFSAVPNVQYIHMYKFFSFCERYSPSVLRISMAMVILWFGFQQLFNASAWIAYIPDSAVALTHLSALGLVYINGLFELVFGTALLFGFQTRFAALLLGLHLLDIMYVVGYGEIGVRDFGLAFGTLAVFMAGPDPLCIQGRKSARSRDDDVPAVCVAERPRQIV